MIQFKNNQKNYLFFFLSLSLVSSPMKMLVHHHGIEDIVDESEKVKRPQNTIEKIVEQQGA